MHDEIGSHESLNDGVLNGPRSEEERLGNRTSKLICRAIYARPELDAKIANGHTRLLAKKEIILTMSIT